MSTMPMQMMMILTMTMITCMIMTITIIILKVLLVMAPHLAGSRMPSPSVPPWISPDAHGLDMIPMNRNT
eukprot:11030680-Karenia_brevis.AAC.1